MKRLDKIFQYIEEKQGTWTTSELALQLQLARPNVSRALNQLVRQGKLKKTTSRPVEYYLSEQSVMKTQSASQTSVQQRLANELSDGNGVKIAFDGIIGSNGSLKNQIQQGKAALLYPPHGLNTMITGPTGSGKTYFANAMYQFAKQQRLLAKPHLVTFNCADYAHNPQLLMSHLFGYVQGAFTGANQNQAGLIAAADGGMLFLDEVHRLPPEGQEMIFYFMDNGAYRRMGETNHNRHANVRLVCATTEDPSSALLQTFVRRIPILIQLPAFDQRPLKEQLVLLRQLLVIEANRIHRKIVVDSDVVQALLGSVTFGNIGQLKSNVQLVCAREFVNQLTEDTALHLWFNQLPANIASGLTQLASNRHALGQLSRLLEPTLEVEPQADLQLAAQDDYELPFNLYEMIGAKAAMLKKDGVTQAEINHYIMTDVNVHLKSLYHDEHTNNDADERIKELITPELLGVTREIAEKLQEDGYPVRRNFNYALSLHISSFIKRMQSGQPARTASLDLVAMIQDYPAELKYAKTVKQRLEHHYDIVVPQPEVDYLAILLVSLRSEPQNGKIGVIVATHGNSTAKSMVQVVVQMLGADNLYAFDMPLSMSPKVAFEKLTLVVKQADKGNGVLLLVDMGSLTTFASQLEKRTKVSVAVVSLVSTPLVIEAARKTGLIQTKLRSLAKELNEFGGYSPKPQPVVQPPIPVSVEEMKIQPSALRTATKPKLILTICSSGEGAAAKIKAVLEPLVAKTLPDTQIKNVSLVNLATHIEKLKRSYRIIASVGIVDPKQDMPHLSLEQLLAGQADKFIFGLANEEAKQLPKVEPAVVSQELTAVAMKMINDCYTFLNAQKLTPLLCRYCELIVAKNPLNFSAKTNLIMHLAGVIERTIQNKPLTAPMEQVKQLAEIPVHQAVERANRWLDGQLNIKIAPSETYYLCKLIAEEQS